MADFSPEQQAAINAAVEARVAELLHKRQEDAQMQARQDQLQAEQNRALRGQAAAATNEARLEQEFRRGERAFDRSTPLERAAGVRHAALGLAEEILASAGNRGDTGNDDAA